MILFQFIYNSNLHELFVWAVFTQSYGILPSLFIFGSQALKDTLLSPTLLPKLALAQAFLNTFTHVHSSRRGLMSKLWSLI